MSGVAELILSFCDLLEAEGRVLRINIMRIARGCLILTLGIAFGGAALIFFVASAYEWLLTIFSKTATLAIMGGICLLIAIVLLWGASYCGKQTKRKQKTEKDQ